MYEDNPQSNRDILTLTETESRLSLGMTSNKIDSMDIHSTYLKIFCSNFFFAKSMVIKTLPAYDLDICPNFCRFFYDLSPN